MLKLFVASAAATFEKLVAEGEIAYNEQFLLLPQCFELNFVSLNFHLIRFSIYLLRWFQMQSSAGLLYLRKELRESIDQE